MFKKIAGILREISGFERIEADFSLVGDLGLDSLGMVTLLIALEDAFDIQLDETDMNPFGILTVNDVIELVDKYKRGEK